MEQDTKKVITRRAVLHKMALARISHQGIEKRLSLRA
jgi:hypothetical protein